MYGHHSTEYNSEYKLRVKTSASLSPGQARGALRGRNQAFVLADVSSADDTSFMSHSSSGQAHEALCDGLVDVPLLPKSGNESTIFA